VWFFGLGWSRRIEAGVVALRLGYRVGLGRAWMNQPTSLCGGEGKSWVARWVGGRVAKVKVVVETGA